eukprot:TRINITY_DN11104_c0_g1_i1.p1 TRINITY_DN11104_c0_g1~~TRINITY_DN11104_c0_g1_i1.p1  ORF type:complete len:235 (+),score=91.93 TRINITY_DN11104_c0_g1_i1:44-706(+)
MVGSASATAVKKERTGSSLGQIIFELNYLKLAEDEVLEQMNEEMVEEAGLPDDIPVGGGKLMVHVSRGEGLEGASGFGNCYVKVSFRNEERRTEVHALRNEIDFDDAPFGFFAYSSVRDDRLQVELWSKNEGITRFINPKEIIGYCDIMLEDAVRNGRINDFYHLTNTMNGRLKIELQWREKHQPKQQQAGADAATTAKTVEQQQKWPATIAALGVDILE